MGYQEIQIKIGCAIIMFFPGGNNTGGNLLSITNHEVGILLVLELVIGGVWGSIVYDCSASVFKPVLLAIA